MAKGVGGKGEKEGGMRQEEGVTPRGGAGGGESLFLPLFTALWTPLRRGYHYLLHFGTLCPVTATIYYTLAKGMEGRRRGGVTRKKEKPN